MVFHSEEGTSYTLFRCNGNHGEVVPYILNPTPHFGYHTHQITAEFIGNNINEPKHSELTKEYASYEQAMEYFCRYVGIEDADKHFTTIKQPRIFEE